MPPGGAAKQRKQRVRFLVKQSSAALLTNIPCVSRRRIPQAEPGYLLSRAEIRPQFKSFLEVLGPFFPKKGPNVSSASLIGGMSSRIHREKPPLSKFFGGFGPLFFKKGPNVLPPHRLHIKRRAEGILPCPAVFDGRKGASSVFPLPVFGLCLCF